MGDKLPYYKKIPVPYITSVLGKRSYVHQFMNGGFPLSSGTASDVIAETIKELGSNLTCELVIEKVAWVLGFIYTFTDGGIHVLVIPNGKSVVAKVHGQLISKVPFFQEVVVFDVDEQHYQLKLEDFIGRRPFACNKILMNPPENPLSTVAVAPSVDLVTISSTIGDHFGYTTSKTEEERVEFLRGLCDEYGLPYNRVHDPTKRYPNVVELVWRHVLNGLCGGSEELALYVFEWISAVVRGQQTRTIPIVTGGQQKGKSTFGDIMKYTLGECAWVSQSTDQLTNNFNGFLNGVSFVSVEEMPEDHAGQRKFMEWVKGMATLSDGALVKKYQEAVRAKFRLNFTAMSNYSVFAVRGDMRSLFLTVEYLGMDHQTELYNAIEDIEQARILYVYFSAYSRETKFFNLPRPAVALYETAKRIEASLTGIRRLLAKCWTAGGVKFPHEILADRNEGTVIREDFLITYALSTHFAARPETAKAQVDGCIDAGILEIVRDGKDGTRTFKLTDDCVDHFTPGVTRTKHLLEKRARDQSDTPDRVAPNNRLRITSGPIDDGGDESNDAYH